MLDLRLTFDITPAFAKAIGDIADAIRGKGMISLVEGGKCSAFDATLHDIDPGFAKASRDITDALRRKLSAPESAEAVEADAPVEPVEAPKPKRGRPRKADAVQKDAQAAPESTETVEAANSTPGPESAPQVQTSCEPVAASEPQAEAKTEPKAEPVAAPAPAPKPSGDSYGGMPLLQAVQALLDEVAQRGIELADVNARVRQAAAERGLPYTSAACLMKAIGYDETRKIVLGE